MNTVVLTSGLLFFAASVIVGYGCNGSLGASCTGEQLLQAQAECLSYGKDFVGTSNAEGTVACGISSMSGACSIMFDGACTVICVSPGEGSDTNHEDESAFDEEGAAETSGGGHASDGAVDTTGEGYSSTDGAVADGLEIAGTWLEEFAPGMGISHVIDEARWDQMAVFGDAVFHIDFYDNEAGVVVAQGDAANEFSPGLWTRFDWTWEGDVLLHGCVQCSVG